VGDKSAMGEGTKIEKTYKKVGDENID